MNLQLEIRKPTNIFANDPTPYDYYFSLDWSLDNVTICQLRSSSVKPKVVKQEANVKLLKEYIKSFRGKRILCFEETTGSHWLYVELKEYVDRIVICDPYRNALLSEGAKSDKIDAIKLCYLLRSGLLKEVFHSSDKDFELRKIVSSYEDWIKFGVRFKNQNSALLRSVGLAYKKEKVEEKDVYLKFIESHQRQAIDLYEEKRKEYQKLFAAIRKQNEQVENLTTISGINDISAVTIYSKVIDAERFTTKYQYWSYCGLVKHEKESGGKNYGYRRPRYCRKLKSVYKAAALSAIGGKNDIREYYDTLLNNGMTIRNARNAIARYIAKATYGILKTKTSYKPFQWRSK
jgi:transposase